MVMIMSTTDIEKNGSLTRKRKKRVAAKKARPKAVNLETPADRPTERVSIDSAGRLVVPAKFRKAIGLNPGDPVTVTLENDALSIRTAHDTLKSARALMRAKNPTGKSLVDELIAERRAEQARE